MALILLDTNAYVAFRQGNFSVMKFIAECNGIVMSTVVLGELLFGFQNGSRFEDNMKSLRSFLAEPEVTTMHVSLATAHHYGCIAAELKSKGTPIPTNDIWIASHAMEAGVPIVTFDRHFRSIDGVQTFNPEAG